VQSFSKLKKLCNGRLGDDANKDTLACAPLSVHHTHKSSKFGQATFLGWCKENVKALFSSVSTWSDWQVTKSCLAIRTNHPVTGFNQIPLSAGFHMAV